MESFPDKSDLLKQIEDKEMIEKIEKYINNLPQKQKEVIRKFSKWNEQLSASETRNKSRGLNKIKRDAEKNLKL